MRKRLLIFAIILAAAVAVIAVVVSFPITLYVPMGVVKHEAFFAGKPTSYWARALQHEPFLGEEPAGGDIGKSLRDGGAAAVPVLCELAESPDDGVRSEALLALALMGTEAKAATPELEATLKKEKNSTRFLLAGEALANVDPAAGSAALGAIARDKAEEGIRRSWALTALLKLAPKGPEAVPALNDLLHNAEDDPVLRVQAARILWHMKQPAEPLVTALCEFITADKGTAGVQALEALGEMGPAAKPALPTLRKLLDKPTLELTGRRWGAPHRGAVIRTLGQIGPDAAADVPTLIAFLKVDNYYIRTEVAIALANMGPGAKQALATREAGWFTCIGLLAAGPPANLVALPLIQTMRRTWVPRGELNHTLVRQAILQVDPTALARVGAD